VTFDQVCPPLATNTPTPLPTATWTPTSLSTPTPTRTPTPTAGPASIEFWADRTEVPAGQCLHLGWRVRNVQAVYLNDQGVIGEEVRQVCPTSDTTYILRVVTLNGEEYRRIDVHVLPATATPSATATPASGVSRPPTTPAAANAVPTLTPTRTPTPPPPISTATHTPAALAMAGSLSPTPPPPPAAAVAQPTPPPPNTPKVWARAGEAPAPRGAISPTPSPAEASAPHWGEYGVFAGVASLLAALAAWAVRRQTA
ncbi:MAG: hypothetical protein ACP5TV_01190, partial [Anaerolineae bacterium]